MPKIEDARTACRQITHIGGKARHPSQEYKPLPVRRYAEATHAIAGPTCESFGFLNRLRCAAIEPHFPKVARIPQKVLGLLDRVDQSSIGQPESIIHSPHFRRREYGSQRPAFQVAAYEIVSGIVGPDVNDSLSIRGPIGPCDRTVLTGVKESPSLLSARLHPPDFAVAKPAPFGSKRN